MSLTIIEAVDIQSHQLPWVTLIPQVKLEDQEVIYFSYKMYEPTWVFEAVSCVSSYLLFCSFILILINPEYAEDVP